MKGAVAAMLHTARSFVETDTKPPVTLQFAFVSDEEIAGPAGLHAVLDRNILNADACVVGETTCEAGLHSVTTADKGSIWLTLEATGTAAHGSRPQLGTNAIDRLRDALTDLETWLEQLTFDIDDEVLSIIDEWLC